VARVKSAARSIGSEPYVLRKEGCGVRDEVGYAATEAVRMLSWLSVTMAVNNPSSLREQ
jgi:hypothetical protein